MPSTVIHHFNYNDKSHTLTIIFVTGLVYHYKNVPEDVYKKFKAAGSKGRYFNHFIKDKFKFNKVED